MNVELYTKPNCSQCTTAKNLLRNRQIPFTEYKLNEDFTREILLSKFPEASSFPVIVVDNYRIPGFDVLKEMVNQSSTDTRKLLNEGN